jgi:hypothetical protein
VSTTMNSIPTASDGCAISLPTALSPRARLMIETFAKSDRLMSPRERNAISLQALADGLAPCNSQGGETDLFGLPLRPANLSPTPVPVEVTAMSDTFGQVCLPSSESESLQSSLERSLRERLGSAGSTPWPLTWRRCRTPSGRRYCQLVLSRLPTSGLASGLWPTPTAKDCDNAGNRNGNPNSKAHKGTSLTDAARMFPTPAHRDYRFPNLENYRARFGHKKGEQLPNHIGGPLNPRFVAWLMGYPEGWANCAPSATPSSRKSRNNSSRR